MLSTVANLLQVTGAGGPAWLGLAVLALIVAFWVYRQARRSLAEVERKAAASARAQGERIGSLEQEVGWLDLRRQQVEAELEDAGVALPYWPPDGPRPRRDIDDEPADDAGPATEARRVPVPPLSPDEMASLARYRRAP